MANKNKLNVAPTQANEMIDEILERRHNIAAQVQFRNDN